MTDFQLIGIFIILNVLLIGTYLVLNIYFRKFKSNIKKMLLLFITFILLTGVLFIPFFLLLNTEPLVAGIFRLMGMQSAAVSLYFLNRFSRIVGKLEKSTQHRLKVNISSSGMTLMIILPWNHWNTLDISEASGFSLQPVTVFILFSIAVYIFVTTAIRSKHAVEKIKDPALRETYKWLNRSFKAIFLTLPALFCTIVYYLIPDNETVLYTTVICFLIGSIAVIFSFSSIYIGLKFPKVLMKRLYQQYEPMWNKHDTEQKLANMKLQKLEELFFE